MGQKSLGHKLLVWQNLEATIQECQVGRQWFSYSCLDLERYAEKIGALTKAELRVSRDRDGDDDEFQERPSMRRAVVNQDDEDDWD
jgi:hypothetical protein